MGQVPVVQANWRRRNMDYGTALATILTPRAHQGRHLR
jgi:hypothetical protein